MIGDHQPVERACKFYRLSRRRLDLFTASKSVGVFMIKNITEESRIKRKPRMQVSFTSIDITGKVALRIRRIGFSWIQTRQLFL